MLCERASNDRVGAAGATGSQSFLSAIRAPEPDVIKLPLLTNSVHPSYLASQTTFCSLFPPPDTKLNYSPAEINRHGQRANRRRDTRSRRRARQRLCQGLLQHRLRNHTISRWAKRRETSQGYHMGAIYRSHEARRRCCACQSAPHAWHKRRDGRGRREAS